MSGRNGHDKIAAAIAGVDQEAPRATVKVTVGPERFAVVNVPVDLTAMELLALLAFLPSGMPKLLARERASGPKLVVASSLPT